MIVQTDGEYFKILDNGSEEKINDILIDASKSIKLDVGMMTTVKVKESKNKIVMFTSEDDASSWLDVNKDKEIMKVDFNATEHHPVIGIWYRVD